MKREGRTSSFPSHAANERTFLAWVRTAISMVGFGLVAARVGDTPPSTWSTLALLITGGSVVVAAFLQMRRVRATLRSGAAEPEEGIDVDGFLVALILTLFATMAAFGVHVS